MRYSILPLVISSIVIISPAYSDTEERLRLNNNIRLDNIDKFKKAIRVNDLSSVLGRGFQTGFKDGEVCTTPFPISTSQLDPHRSLLVHDEATLSSAGVNFSLKKTLEKIANQVSSTVPGTTFDTIFKQMWDTQNHAVPPPTPSTAIISGNTHCDDNGGNINNFPLTNCPRREGEEAISPIIAINEYKPIALVNRVDLSHKGWKNCGEHRIIYGKSGGGIRKNLMIFEAVLPNPKPGCRSGCRDVIEFWANLSNDSNPDTRASKLESFYYNGLPGFSPVVHVNHYSSSATASIYGGSDSGQIRTNQFLQFPWQLKEFKTLTTCIGGGCEFDIVPISVKGNPYGQLWSKDIATGGGLFATRASSFQSKTSAQVTDALLGNPDLNSFSYAVAPNKNAADSTEHLTVIDNYSAQMNSSINIDFKNNLASLGASLTTPLTANQIANRATALSCAGCHMPVSFGLLSPNSVGPGQQWPDTLGFVHVDINTQSMNGLTAFNPAHFSGNSNGFPISPALINEFLPTRANNLAMEYNKEICNCEPSILRPPFPFPRPTFPLPNFPGKFTINLKNKSLLDSAVKDLIDPNLFRDANEQLRKSELLLASKKNLTKRDLTNSLKKRREIIRKVETSMMDNPSLKIFSLQISKPAKFIEKVNLTQEQVKTLELKDKSSFKRKLANDLVLKFPQRETVTGSFRTH